MMRRIKVMSISIGLVILLAGAVAVITTVSAQLKPNSNTSPASASVEGDMVRADTTVLSGAFEQQLSDPLPLKVAPSSINKTSLWMKPWAKPRVATVVEDPQAKLQPQHEIGVDSEVRRAAQQELNRMGFATIEDDQFEVLVAEADDAGYGAILVQAGFTEQEIRNAQERQREFYEEGNHEAWARQLASLNVLAELRRHGFADLNGNVNVAAADDGGYRDLLLHAGFTELQILDAQRRQRQVYEEAGADAWFQQLSEIQQRDRVVR